MTENVAADSLKARQDADPAYQEALKKARAYLAFSLISNMTPDQSIKAIEALKEIV